MAYVSVQTDDFDLNAEVACIRAGNQDIGAVVSFIGTVRDIDGSLRSMTLEHYPGMTEQELERIANEAEKRWPLIGCRIIHRFGTLKPADNIVLVITASRHRSAAFEAADFLMDFLKSNAPFWKKETTAGKEQWVEAKAADEQALERWNS
ncbi:molybdenum cofactor biosynthesis protein MoaE [Kordiimonas aquimaris]|uniref:molybdenum cofactor biosynthesis protein MoaE n=1 Tax=Kordiimonas aquimaris TaxID=707591 RepID=UPI0021D1B46B|nr:molybdenum cofactor biosynthesis protein MoaE [Kordiimonas aquimaris]